MRVIVIALAFVITALVGLALDPLVQWVSPMEEEQTRVGLCLVLSIFFTGIYMSSEDITNWIRTKIGGNSSS